MAKIVNSHSQWGLEDLIRKIAGDIVETCKDFPDDRRRRALITDILRDKFLPRLPNCDLPNYGQTSLKVTK